ncbi:unnamed protein product [Rotaria sp. Silwood1]|nr:unnamed protein product [Rotaria sp. Silwood1]
MKRYIIPCQKGRPLRSSRSYVNGRIAWEYDISNSIFIPATFASYYYQYGMNHGPFNMKLGFYPEAGYIVHGGGNDDVGTYIITGIYSPRTLRMSLKKHYQTGTGNPQENLGHKVKIQVEWNHYNQQFEGKYYVRTRLHKDENIFIIRYEGTAY